MTRYLVPLSLVLLLLTAPLAVADDPEMSPAEKELVELTNKERARAKLPPLKPNPLLFKIARAHAANMARQGKLEHRLDGKSVKDRALAAGYNYKKIGENIAWSDGDTLANIMKNWMKSPEHRKNLLTPVFTEIGFGIARDKKGETYYAQVMGLRRASP